MASASAVKFCLLVSRIGSPSGAFVFSTFEISPSRPLSGWLSIRGTHGSATSGKPPHLYGPGSSSVDVGCLGSPSSDTGAGPPSPRSPGGLLDGRRGRIGAQAESGTHVYCRSARARFRGSVTPHRAFFAEKE